jgi:hypothetical protein
MTWVPRACASLLLLAPACASSDGEGGGTDGGTSTSVTAADTTDSSAMTSSSMTSSSMTSSSMTSSPMTTTSDTSTSDESDTTPADTSSGETGTDPTALDDDFDDPALPGWTTFRPEAAAVSVDGGVLHLDPGVNTVWLDAATSILLWKEVEGDFMVTAALRSHQAGNIDVPPPSGFRFGGLMARDGGGGPENYVFIVLGTDTDPSVETKSTVDSGSTYQGPAWPTARGEVRLCRIGARFEMYVREADGAWQISNAFDRPDLPAALQVGPIAYNNAPDPQLRVSFDFVDFEPLDDFAACLQ